MLDFAADPARSPFGGVDRSGYARDIGLAIQATRDARLPADRFCADTTRTWGFQADIGDVTLRLPAMPASPGKITGIVRALLERRSLLQVASHRMREAGDLVVDASVREIAVHLGIRDEDLEEALTLVRTRPRVMIASNGPIIPSGCAVHVGPLKLVRQKRRILAFTHTEDYVVAGDAVTFMRPVTLPDAAIPSLPGKAFGTVVGGLPFWRDATIRKTWSSDGRLSIQVEPRPMAA